MKTPTHNNRIKILVNSKPYSSDPLEYDSFIHHIAFESTFTNLVTQYKLGQHTPILAESWKISEDRKEWTFFLRKDLKFSDGSIINAESVEKSWLRIAKIMKSRNSKSGFFENVVGFEKLAQDSQNLDGLTAKEFILNIKLNQPMPKLLDKISFGLYSVVHPSQFDSQSLKWIDKKNNIITSGAYQIKEWDDQHLILSLQKNYPSQLLHSNPISEVEFFWNKDKININEMDIVSGSELSPPENNSFILKAGPPSYIMYMRIMSWMNPESIFFKKENRLYLRNIFYKMLENNNTKPIKSFFPLIIKNIKPFDDLQINDANLKSKLFCFPEYDSLILKIPLFEKIITSSLNMANELHLNTTRKKLSFETLMSEIQNKTKVTSCDMDTLVTGILASDPIEDVKFMFRSKEGILLPDETGEILTELDKSPVDLQKVNQLLWDQGLIWPVTHYASGLWARPDLDFSQINLVLPPTSFQWIGWKN